MDSILLDQNVPGRLRHQLPGHDAKTAFHMGWAALMNGALIAAAETAGFDILITADRNLRHQQNLAARHIALVILSSNKWSTVQHNLPLIQQALSQAGPGTVQDVFLDRDQG